MTVLLVPLGSHGDVHPFVGIGLALRARGHQVKILANPYFRPLIEKAGLELAPVSTAEAFLKAASNPVIWRRFRGTKTMFVMIGELLAPVYEAIARNYVPGQTVVAASTLALGARVAQEHLRIPTATIHLQPSLFRSVIEPPYLQGLFMPSWMPRWTKRAQFALGDRVIDRLIATPLNEFRGSLGLAPVKQVLGQYLNSPQRVIGLFPQWFAAPQPDWPPQARLTGFPLYDESGVERLAEPLLRFLAQGEPPIAFTPGSAMFFGHRFFEESARACGILGRRGVLLTRHNNQVPRSLPPGVIHVEYAPFSELLPRCAALVHHGGIGTSAQGLAAGVPQLVVPHSYDQPDNARRLKRLGVARVINPRRYRAARAARELGELTGSSGVLSACREVGRRFDAGDPLDQTCRLILELAGDVAAYR